MEKGLRELAKEIHTLNKEKGFWDGERNISEALMLVISEMGEAIEAHRKVRFSDLPLFKRQLLENEKRLFPLSFERLFKNNITDTFEDEISDIAIRLLDLCGYYEVFFKSESESDIVLTKNVGANLMEIIPLLSFCNAYYKKADVENVKHYLELSVNVVFAFASHHNINLQKHIEYKLKYNLSRPRLHGKKY